MENTEQEESKNIATPESRSKGGKKRAENLSPERRKEIAQKAVKARWDKKRQEATVTEQLPDDSPKQPVIVSTFGATVPSLTSLPLLPPPTVAVIRRKQKPAGQKKRRPKERALPKAYGLALAAAERDHAQCLEDLAYHMQMVAQLQAHIPFLTQTIRALGGAVGQSRPAQQAPFQQVPQPQYVAPVPLVPVQAQEPRIASLPTTPGLTHVQGAAMDENFGQEDLPEDYFLRGSAGGNKGWI
jgi:hypothetical protein